MTKRGHAVVWAGMVFILSLLASPLARAQTQIVAFGTSFTNGYGVGRSAAYPALLEEALKAKGYAVVVRNEGVNGDTARGGLSRVDSAVPTGTTLAIVEFGVNEITGQGGSEADIGPALQGIASNLRARGIKAIYLGRRGTAQYLRGLGGPVLDLKLSAHVDDATKHPNAEGHALAARQILPTVVSILGKPKR